MPNPGAQKRIKELARLEKQRAKEAKREQRRKERQERAQNAAVTPGEDPDIAGIIPGPQPPLEF